MPWKSKRPCGRPGCKELVDAGARYCARHKPTRNYDASHYDYRWRKLRTLYIAKNPLCAECEKAGRLTPATEVHHIVAVADGGSDRDENLQALCKSCHSRKTAKESRFGW